MIDSDYKCQFEIAFNFFLYFYHFTPLQFITIILHQRVQIKFILAVFKIYVESANQKACFPRITTLRKKIPTSFFHEHYNLNHSKSKANRSLAF